MLKKMRLVALGAGLAAGVIMPARAQMATNPVDQLLSCRTEADATKRLACMDAAAAEIERRRGTGELRISLKKEEEKRMAREFGQSEKARGKQEAVATADPKTEKLPERLKVDKIESTIAGATRPPATQLWTILLADGGVWRQVDGGRVTDDLKPGQKVEVKRAMLGGFVMLVEGAAPMHVRRVN